MPVPRCAERTKFDFTSYFIYILRLQTAMKALRKIRGCVRTRVSRPLMALVRRAGQSDF